MKDDLKRRAGLAALEEVHDGMIVGLGSGTTAAHFIMDLGARVRSGLRVRGIPTSESSARLAEAAGIPLTSLREAPHIDVTVDGADEVSPQLDLIKGLGGALVREKIIAHASGRVIIVVDESKLVEQLGARTPIPVEVVPFAKDFVMRRLSAWGGTSRLRETAGKPVVSDNGNYTVDWKFGPLVQPALFEKQLKAVTGVVDSGLFCYVAQTVIVAGASGIRRIEREG